MMGDNKPPLDEALLVHFGVPGMHWGHRKTYTYGPAAPAAPRTQGNARTHTHNVSAPVAPKPKKSKAKKIAFGVAAVASVAVTAAVLERVGNRAVVSALSTNHLDLGSAGSSAAQAARSFTNHLDLGSSVVNSSGFSHVMSTPLSAANVQSLYDIARG